MRIQPAGARVELPCSLVKKSTPKETRTHVVQGSAVNVSLRLLRPPDLCPKAWSGAEPWGRVPGMAGKETEDRLSVGPRGLVSTRRNQRGER